MEPAAYVMTPASAVGQSLLARAPRRVIHVLCTMYLARLVYIVYVCVRVRVWAVSLTLASQISDARSRLTRPQSTYQLSLRAGHTDHAVQSGAFVLSIVRFTLLPGLS